MDFVEEAERKYIKQWIGDKFQEVRETANLCLSHLPAHFSLPFPPTKSSLESIESFSDNT